MRNGGAFYKDIEYFGIIFKFWCYFKIVVVI